jgi:methyltransferase (TIGR00027 family)
MPKAVALLAFVIIEIALLPITILGTILFYLHFSLDFLFLKIRGKQISMTVYDPMFARWILHMQGKREDQAAGPILFSLPGVSAVTVWLLLGPTLLGLRLTGLTIHMYDYPVYSSSNIIDALGHRTRFFDDAVLSYVDKVDQLVILGAGWDTRAYRFSQNENLRLFEVDAPDTQNQKIRALEKANLDPSEVTFAAADFNRESWLDALERVGFDPEKPSFFLFEGVTYYLEAESVNATLQTVAAQLAKGSAIAFDYAGRHIIEGDTSLIYRLVVFASRVMREGWIFGIPTESPAREQLTAFLKEKGLRLTEYEAIGKADKKGRLDGGLALAVNGEA